MAFPTATQHTDGTAMSFGGIFNNLDAYRDALNDLDVSLVEDASLRAEHIPRPRVLPFPMSAQLGERHLVAGRTFALGAPDTARALQWASRERLAIAPWALSAGGMWRLPLGWRVRLPSSAYVEVAASWEWQVRSQRGTVASAPGYPNGTGTGTGGVDGGGSALPSRAGYFALVKTFLASGETTELEETQNFAYPLWPHTGDSPVENELFNDRGHVLWSGQLAQGTWDVQLVYVVDNETTNIMQIDVSRWSGKLEAHL